MLPIRCQDLVHIPDSSFRVALEEKGLLTNDSLDINKVRSKKISAITFKGLGIENLNGIQYFDYLQVLNISENNLTTLDYLPSNLNILYCSHNKISNFDIQFPDSLIEINMANNLVGEINQMPPYIEKLNLRDNRITKVNCSAPESLRHFSLAGNLIQEMSCDYSEVDFINLFENPIKVDGLCQDFVEGPYKSIWQNCRTIHKPYQSALNEDYLEGILEDSVIVVFGQAHSWPPVLLELDTFIYKLNSSHDSFLLSGISFEKRMVKDEKVTGIKEDSLVTGSFPSSLIDELIYHIDNEVLEFEFQLGEELIPLSLEDLPYSHTYSTGGCSDCSTYGVFVKVKRRGRHFSTGYSYSGSIFTSMFQGDLIVYPNALRWITCFFVLNELFAPDHKVTKMLSSERILRKLQERINDIRR